MSEKNELSLLTTQHAIFPQTQRCVLKLLQMNNQELSGYVQNIFERNPFLTDESEEVLSEFFAKKHGQMRWMDEPNKIENLLTNCDFDDAPSEIPDIIIEIKGNNDLECYISDFFSPKIFLNEVLYRKSCAAIRNDFDRYFVKTQFEAAKFLIKSINSRNSILLKITNEVTYRQSDFLLGERNDMMPVDVKDVAISLMLPENTVKKAIENKIVQTPRGIFSLKSLLPKKTKLSTEISYAEKDIEVKNYINQLINDEPRQSPYSDDEIACLLNSHGINLSRRTVTKYRNNLKIPNLTERNKIYEMMKISEQ